jgi:hypothetical protein
MLDVGGVIMEALIIAIALTVGGYLLCILIEKIEKELIDCLK